MHGNPLFVHTARGRTDDTVAPGWLCARVAWTQARYRPAGSWSCRGSAQPCTPPHTGTLAKKYDMKHMHGRVLTWQEWSSYLQHCTGRT